eukprot:6181473-Pleurochrysis_carterae.AAC.2
MEGESDEVALLDGDRHQRLGLGRCRVRRARQLELGEHLDLRPSAQDGGRADKERVRRPRRQERDVEHRLERVDL